MAFGLVVLYSASGASADTVTRQAVRDFWFDPGSATVLHAGDRLIVFAFPEAIDSVESLFE